MALGISVNRGGDILPYVKIDGKNGIVSRSTYEDGTRGIEQISDFVALYDFDTLQVGWFKFSDQGPDKRLVAIGDPMPDRPSEDHKQGVQFCLSLPGGLGVHELSTNASGVLGAIDELHDKVLAAPENGQGQVPVVRLTRFDKEGKGTKARAIPVFEIIGWKPRPQELADRKVSPKPRATMPNASKPAGTGSTVMTPPVSSNPYAAQSQGGASSMPDFG